MKRHLGERERYLYELSQINRWYLYEQIKKHLNSDQREAEVRELAKALKV